MPFDASKYLGKQKKKRTCRDYFRYKYLKHKRYCKEQYKKYDAQEKYAAGLHAFLNKKNDIANNEPYSLLKNWCQLIGYVLIFVGIYFASYFIIHYWEAVVAVLLLILYGVCWLIGIVLAFLVSKMFFVFLYQTSINIASNFVVDVLDEVKRKRAKRRGDF